jgi:hypothetical protein
MKQIHEQGDGFRAWKSPKPLGDMHFSARGTFMTFWDGSPKGSCGD